MVLLGDVCQVKAHFSLVGDSLNLGANWCTACPECTTGMEIFLGTPKGTSRGIGLVQGRFGPFGDSINLNAR
jgi:hypothetical protein